MINRKSIGHLYSHILEEHAVNLPVDIEGLQMNLEGHRINLGRHELYN